MTAPLHRPPATTALVAMRADAFAAYAAASIAGYAADNVASGRWPAADAARLSQAEFDGLLPQGLATPDHHLYEIVAGPGGEVVGAVWFAAQVRNDVRNAYVYDVEIAEPFRRLGHARRAFVALEPIVAALGLPSIGLHVFGFNEAAQALYRQLGYAVTGINMLKTLP